MIFRTLPITLLQIFCKIILNVKVIIKRVIEPDDLFCCIYCSGGMMVLHEHKTQRSTYIDFRETAPSGATKDMFNKNYHQAMRVSTHDCTIGMGTADRFICDTGLSIAVNQSKTGPPSTRFGFLCMHRVSGGVIKLSAPTSSLASQCLPSATIKQPFQKLSSLVPCPLSLCSEAF